MNNRKVRISDRLLAIILTVLMVMSAMPVSAFATEETEGGSRLITNIGELSFKVGQETEFTFTTEVSEADAGRMVVGTSTFSDENAIVKYLETKDGNWYVLTGESFGPASGFPLTDGATSTFSVTFATPGVKTFTAYIQDAQSGKIVCETEVTFTVADKEKPVLSTSITAETEFVVGEWTVFTFSTLAKDYAGTMIIGTSDFTSESAKVQYWEPNTPDGEGAWLDLTGKFGPADGFPLGDFESKFQVMFTEAEDCTFTASIMYATGEQVLASVGPVAVNVKDKFDVTATKNGNGTVELKNGENTAADALTVVEGSTVSLDVVPDEGWWIQSVSIDGAAQEVTDYNKFNTTFEVNEDIAVEVVFVEVFTVDVTYENEKGAVQVGESNNGGSVTVVKGTDVEIIATPETGYRVTEVKIGGEVVDAFDGNTHDSANPYKKELKATKNYTVAITFAPLVYSVTLGSAENGQLKVDKTQVEYDKPAVVTITPHDGYTVDTATVKGESGTVDVYKNIIETESDSEFTLTVAKITEDKEIVVTFKKCETTTASDAGLSWNDEDALRHNGNLYVFKNGTSVVFETAKKGIRITDSFDNKFGNKVTNSVSVSKNITIKKIEVWYDLGWHEVLIDDSSVSLEIAYDTGKPVVSIKETDETAKQNGYYSNDVLLTVNAEDESAYSGLASVEYMVTSDGETTTEWTEIYTYDSEIEAAFSKDDLKIPAADNDSEKVTVSVRATDRAGNESEIVTVKLKICHTAPTVSITYNDKQSKYADPEGYWYNADRTATVMIVDRDDVFDETEAEKGFAFEDGSVASYAFGEWTHKDGVHTASVTFNREGRYKLNGYSYTNKAGLEATTIAYSGNHSDAFGIDKTDPSGTVKANSSAWDGEGVDWGTFFEKLTFGLYSNKEVTVGLVENGASDALSGEQSVYYYVSDSNAGLTWEDLDRLFEDGAFTKDSVTVEKDRLFAVYVAIVDNAGNVAFVNTNGIIRDATDSIIYDFKLAKEAINGGFYGNNQVGLYEDEDGNEYKGIRADITVSDPSTDGIYSGIKSIDYTVTYGGSTKPTQEGNLYQFDVADPEKKDEWKGFVIIDARANNGPNVTLTVTVTDNAGNITTKSMNIGEICLDDPTISISVDKKAVNTEKDENEKVVSGWYNTERTATVTISDRKSVFDADAATNGIKVTVTDKDGEVIAVTQGVDYTVSDWDSNNNLHTAQITFMRDGNYEWSVSYTDKAGNTATAISYGTSEAPTKFVIDRTNPHGTVTISGYKWTDNILSVLTFGLFAQKEFEVSVVASDNENISPVDVSYYVYNGTKALSFDDLNALYITDNFTAELPELSGQFTLYVRIVDKAGNYIYVSSDGHVIDSSATALFVSAPEAPATGIYGPNDVERFVDTAANGYNGIRVAISAKEADREEDTYAGIRRITYEVKSRNTENEEYVTTQSGTLYDFAYVRDTADNSNGGTLTVTDVNVNGGTPVKSELAQVPTKDMLCRAWNGSIIVNADINNKCDVIVLVTVEDNAGNVKVNNATIEEGEEGKEGKLCKLDIDLTAPTIEVSYNNNTATNEKYFTAERTATVVYTERTEHFDQAAAQKVITDSLKATDAKGKDVSESYSVNWTHGKNNANANTDTHTATITFSKDANYTYSLDCKDLAGNVCESINTGNSVAPFDFVIDTKDPVGSVTVAGNTWTQFLAKLTFGLFGNSSTQVSATADDDTSPVKIEFYKHNGDTGLAKADLDAMQLIAATQGYEKGELDKVLEKVLVENIDSDEQFSIYVRITDMAGHSILMNSDGYIVDTVASALTVTPVTQANEYGIYGIDELKQDGGVRIRIEANDVYEDTDAYAGIAKIEYKVEAVVKGVKEITQSEVLYFFDYERDPGDNANGGKLTVTDKNAETVSKNGQVPLKSELCTSWNGDIIVDAVKNNSSNVTVTVVITDNAGNTTTKSVNLDINNTTPTLDVTFDNNTALNQNYFYAKRTATIVITERKNHFSSVAANDGIVITAKDKDGKDLEGAYTVKSWNTNDDGNDPDKHTHTVRIEFVDDAHYTFAVSYTGKSGNPATVNMNDSVAHADFYVDTMNPTGSVTVDTHIWSKLIKVLTFGLYSSKTADVTLADEDNLSPTFIEYYKTNDPVALTESALNTLYSEGKFKAYSDPFKVKVSEQFVIYARITDFAGNFIYVSSDGYIVDDVAAAVRFIPDPENAPENGIYNTDVRMLVDVTENEDYSGIAKIEYWVISKGVETQRETLFAFDYTREEGENTNGGSLTVTDWASGKKVVNNYTGNVPTMEQLYNAWSGSFIVNAAINDSSDTVAYIRVTDNAGNVTNAKVALDIDVTDPVIEVSYEETANEKAKDGYYTSRTATVSITERTDHFSAADATAGIEITAVDGAGTAIENAYVISNWTTQEGETPDDAVHTATIRYVADANYTFAVSYTDKARNENVPVKTAGVKNAYAFTVDTTKPTGTVTAKSAEGREETWSSIVDELTFGFWSNTKISVSGTSADVTSPIQSVEYYMPVAEAAKDNTAVLSKAQLDAVENWKAFTTVDVVENTQFTVYLRITDYAGNYDYIATNGLIVDEEHPVEESVAPEISVSPAKPVNGIYSGDVKVAIEVVDPMVGGTYSGLKEVRYAVYDRDSATPGVPTQEGTLFSFDKEYPKQSELQQKWTGEITVSAAKNNSNNVQIIVYATDNSLNAVDNSQKESKSYTVIRIDTTAPTIYVSYDNNNADSETYFNASRTATITVTERNFNADDVKVTITNTDGTVPSVIGWTNTAGTYNKDDATHTATVTYSADGDYTFAIEYTDLAGNKASGVNYASGSVAPSAFTVDRTNPTVSVSYDNNSVSNEKYFKASRTATVTVVEHNFSENRVVFTQTASLNGAAVSVPSASWVSHNGDTHTAVISYNADGDYTFDVTMTDLAGNGSGETSYGGSVAAKLFTVDMTIAEPVIGGVENGAAYNEAVVPTVAFTDVNFASYEVKLLRTRFGDKNADVSEQFLTGDARIDAGIAGSFDTFEAIAENDGIYTLVLSATDLAGNTASSTKTFTVNRFGSVYAYDDYLVSLIKDGGQFVKKQDGAQTAITKDLVITEYNANAIAANSLLIMITRNGEPVDVKYESAPVASADVTVGASGWFEYVYTISKENFAEDGEYRISISSKDVNDRTSASVPENSIDSDRQPIKDTMSFTVDTTKPELINITFPNAKFLDEYASVNATFIDISYSVLDIGGLKKIEVFVNGESAEVITDFSDSLNTFDGRVTINESNDRQQFEIRVEDIAGNVTSTSAEDFDPAEAYEFRSTVLVSTNGFIRWYENKGMFYGTIGGTVGVALAIGLLVFFVKRKKEKDA